MAKVWELAERVAIEIGVVRLGASLALGIVGLAIAYGGTQAPGVGLDSETSIPAYFSGAVLLGAAVLTWMYTVRSSAGRLTRAAGFAFGGLLLVFSGDEIGSLHERLEAWAGVDWQVLYAPVVLFGGVAGVVLVLHFGRSVPGGLLLLGALCWFVSQVCEAVQWDGDVMMHPALIYPEELLEISGSALFAVAMLSALQSLHARSARHGELTGLRTSGRTTVHASH